jgi:hypothetical protein
MALTFSFHSDRLQKLPGFVRATRFSPLRGDCRSAVFANRPHWGSTFPEVISTTASMRQPFDLALLISTVPAKDGGGKKQKQTTNRKEKS